MLKLSHFKIYLIFFSISLILILCLPVKAADYDRQGNYLTSKAEAKYVPGEVLVKFKKQNIDLTSLAGQYQAANLAFNKNLFKKQDLIKNNISVFKSNSQETTEQVIDKLKADPQVEYVEPNYLYDFVQISNDTFANMMWGLNNTGQNVNGTTGTADADIDAPEAWALSTGNSFLVAVIDSGVAYNHPDLTANLWNGVSCVDYNNSPLNNCLYGYDFEDADKDPQPTWHSHGTHVSGTIGAIKNNSRGILGVSANVDIMNLKTSLATSEIINAISFAEYNGAKVINASFGGTSYSASFKTAIDGFDGLFIAAAGNEGTNNDGGTHFYPCDYTSSNLICVAATQQNDLKASYSNYGATSVDVAAPGSNILSSVAEDQNSPTFLEDFSGVTPPNLPAGWTSGGNWGTYDFGVLTVLYGDVNNLPYDDSGVSTTYATSPTINLSSAVTAAMDFYARCDTENTNPSTNDHMALEISSDGASFTELYRWNTYSLGGTAAFYFDGRYNVIPPSYLTANFKFRFKWYTDGDGNYGSGIGDGCYVYDIYLKTFSDGSDEIYNYYNGTSMATPHVTGLAALLWGYNSNLTASQVKDIIFTTGDNIAQLHPTTGTYPISTGKRVNAYNALNIFQPHGGYTADDVIPNTQITQATDGSGLMTINFRIKDGYASLPTTLNTFEYSVNNGSTWNPPTSGDSSPSLSANWDDNSYQTSTNYSGTVYNFTWDTQDADLSGLNNTEQNDVLIRFKANDGALDSPATSSQAFIVDNLGSTIAITAPTKNSGSDITDTTIQITDSIAITAANVIVDPSTTTGTANFNCSQTSGTQVDCTIDITSSGNLVIKSTDNYGNTNTQTETNYIINNVDPVITITAPTKIKNATITDTTIQVTDDLGVQMANVTVDGSTTAGTANFNCSQTSVTQVDCTIDITSSGDLVIAAVDDFANNVAQPETNYIIETNPPTINITAPTKLYKTTITDTTIQVTDDTGVTAANVVIDGATTAGTANFNCSQTSITQVDCTIDITSDGDLTIAATDDAGNNNNQAETGYIIESVLPIITITAPTKNSLTTIADTTIQVTDNQAITASNVIVDGSSTAGTANFNCSQTSGTQVDCTIDIISSGDLIINATDDATNNDSQTETNYVIDNVPPVITITAPTKIKNTTISDTTIQVTDDLGILAANVIVNGVTTAGTANFNCVQTSATQVDCTIDITSSGNLQIKATDDSLYSTVEFELNYIIEIEPPTIVIIAPTLRSNTTITDTFIQISDIGGGILASNVSLATGTTVIAGNFNCTQVSPIFVNCTVVIYSSGNLSIKAIDKAGNSYQVTQSGYIITLGSAGGGGGGGGGGSTTTPSTPTEPQLILTDPEPAEPLPLGVDQGTLVKRADIATVYFIDNDNRRHTFPNSKTFYSWYSNFDNVKTISLQTLAAIPLGSNVTMRPGTWLIKITTDPKVYTVEPYGVIRWIETEDIAKTLYGADWNKRIVDVGSSFFINYQVGSPISQAIHPIGSVIQYQSATAKYYIENGNKRMISPEVFSKNLFQEQFVIKNLPIDLSYTTGSDLPIIEPEILMTLR